MKEKKEIYQLSHIESDIESCAEACDKAKWDKATAMGLLALARLFHRQQEKNEMQLVKLNPFLKRMQEEMEKI